MKKIFTITIVMVTIALTFTFCKKEKLSISAKKVLLTETVFDQAVLKAIDNDEFTMMGYNNDQKLEIIEYSKSTEEINSKTVNVSASFAVSDFVVTDDGYLISSNSCITKVNNNYEEVWSIAPQAPVTGFGNHIVIDSNNDAWLNGTTQYVSLLKLSSEGVITVIGESDLEGYQTRKIHWASDKNSFFFSNHKTVYDSWTSYSSIVFNINKDGMIAWQASSIPFPSWVEAFPTYNSDCFVFGQEAMSSAHDPRIMHTAILDNTGNEITSNKVTEKDTDGNNEFSWAKKIIDDEDYKVVLISKAFMSVTLDDGHYKTSYGLYFFDNNGALINKIMLDEVLSYNFDYEAVQSFVSTSNDYIFLSKEQNGMFLTLLSKNTI